MSDGSPVAMPNDARVLRTEIVENDEGDVLLEAWVVYPTSEVPPSEQASSSEGQTLYTQTTVDNEQDLRAEIAEIQQERLEEDDEYYYDEY